MSMQVFPTAPSPTVTHFINLDALISIAAAADLLPIPKNPSFFAPPSAPQLLPTRKSCREIPISRQFQALDFNRNLESAKPNPRKRKRDLNERERM